jgi:hypothetical protein
LLSRPSRVISGAIDLLFVTFAGEAATAAAKLGRIALAAAPLPGALPRTAAGAEDP